MVDINTIKQVLLANNLAVERAILVLYARQTSDEQRAGSTTHRNGRGFNAFHAEMGTYYARWLQSGRHLTGKHLEKARKMSLQYAAQLLEEAQAKAAAKAA